MKPDLGQQVGEWAGGPVLDRPIPTEVIGAAETRAPNSAAADGGRSAKRVNPGEIPLGLGLGLLVLAAGLFPSVMVWMLGLYYVAPVAAAMLALGILRARGSGGNGARRGAGLLWLAIGLVTLGGSALAGSQLSFLMSVPTQPAPPSWNLPWLAVRWILPVPLLAHGLSRWTDWSTARRRGWIVTFLLVPVATLVVHRSLVITGMLPLSA